MSGVQCHRCLKLVEYDALGRGAHTCTPTDGWRALEEDSKELNIAKTKIQAALGNGSNEDLWQPGTHWVDAAIRAIQHLENHLQC